MREGSDMIQSTSSFTSFHLASMLSLLISTTKNQYSRPARLRVTLAARQGPALGVMPVLIPSHPCQSILLVFSHFIQFFFISPYTSQQQQQVQYLVPTISRNRVFFMQCMQSLATSSALERLLVLESPCGLAQEERLRPSFLAFRFIQWMYIPTMFSSAFTIRVRASQLQISCLSKSPSLSILRIEPPICAIWWAASLPLGSIIPKYKSSRLSYIPGFNQAVVPIIVQAYRVTLTLTLAETMPAPSQICRMVIRFIIFVRDAISIRLKLVLPLRNFCYRIQYSTQLCAETEGIVILIFLLQCGDCLPFSTDTLDSLDLLESLETSLLSLSCRAEIGLLIRQFLRAGMSTDSSFSSFSS